MALDGQTTTTTDNDILRFDSGQLKFVGVSVGANSILARSGSTDLGATSLSEQQVIGREGGDISAIPIGALGKPSSLSILKGLATSPFSDGDVVYMRGRSSVGDGGEGHFRWDSSDLSTEVGNDEVTTGEGDGGIYVAPASDKTGASGAWVRQGAEYNRRLVSYYGAVGDGSTDVRQAFSDADSVGDFRVPPGVYRIGSDLTLNNRIYVAPNVRIEVDSGVTLTINSLIDASSAEFPFAGQGTITVADEITVNVPADFGTVQGAIDDCPKTLFQDYTVLLADGTYAEDVRIESIESVRALPASIANAAPRVVIAGAARQAEDPNVQLKSVFCKNCTGTNSHPSIADLTVFDATPFDDEDAAVASYGCTENVCVRVSFEGNGVKTCLLSYASRSVARQCNFGNNVNEHAIRTKHQGFATIEGPSSGSVVDQVVNASRGLTLVTALSDVPFGNVQPVRTNAIDSAITGVCVDAESREVWGASSFGDLRVTDIRTHFESLDGYITNGRGGSVSLDATQGVVLDTGSTSGNNPEIRLARIGNIGNNSWSSPRQFGISIDVPNKTGVVGYAVIGWHEGKAVGFKFVNDTLYAVAVASGVETTDSIGTFPRFAALELKYSGSGVCDYYVDGDHKSRLESGFPSGAPNDYQFDVDLETTDASSKSVIVHELYCRIK